MFEGYIIQTRAHAPWHTRNIKLKTYNMGNMCAERGSMVSRDRI